MNYLLYHLDMRDSKAILVNAMVYIHTRVVNCKRILQVH